MRIIAVLLFAVSSSFADDAKNFTVSGSVERSFEEVKTAVQAYFTAARTKHPAIWVDDAKETAGHFVQRWMDCAGAAPGALIGEIVVKRSVVSTTGTQIEVRSGATRPQDKLAAERRRERTKKAMEDIIALLNRKP